VQDMHERTFAVNDRWGFRMGWFGMVGSFARLCRRTRRVSGASCSRVGERAGRPCRLACALAGCALVRLHWIGINTVAGTRTLWQPRIGSGAPARPPDTSAGLVGWGRCNTGMERSIPCGW